MKARSRRGGFSLVEVVLAVGLFAVAVASVLALLPALTRQAGESAERLAAQRWPDAVRVELQRQATVQGWDAFGAAVPVVAATLPNGLRLVGTKATGQLAAGAETEAAIAVDEQYFLIEVWRFAEGALAFEAGDPALALHVRVSWPYRVPGTVDPVALADRSQLTFSVGLNR